MAALHVFLAVTLIGAGLGVTDEEFQVGNIILY